MTPDQGNDERDKPIQIENENVGITHTDNPTTEELVVVPGMSRTNVSGMK